MTKFKSFLAVLIAAAVLIILFAGFGFTAKAEELPDEPPTGQTEEVAPSDDTITERFIEYLKSKYGDDYEYYYNQIIEKWGSVETYLLSLGENFSEEQLTAWQEFVAWLGEYAPVWATILAVVLIVVVYKFGKRALTKILQKYVTSKFKPVNHYLTALEEKSTRLENSVKALSENAQIQMQSTAAIIKAQKALLGNEKFADTVKLLEKAEEGLEHE